MKLKLILQTEASECGLACLAMVSSFYGCQNSLSALRTRFPMSMKGATLAQLIRHAKELQLSTRPVRLDMEALEKLSTPSILHWNLNHFVVLERVGRSFDGKKFAVLFDPAIGIVKLNYEAVSEHFTGVALELSPTPDFRVQNNERRVRVRDLIGKVQGWRAAVAKAILLAGALEMLALVLPLFNQFVIDRVIPTGDRQLLLQLGIGFALLILTQNLILLTRNWLLLRWSMSLSIQWSSRVLAHLMRLPLSYFSRRHLGDVVSRFSSIGAIQSTLTNFLAESLLDGLMVVVALSMMLIYSTELSLIVIAAVCLYALVRVISYGISAETTKQKLILGARESGYLLETVRGIAPIKIFGREADRLANWQNHKIDVQNMELKEKQIAMLTRSAHSGIFAFQGLLVFYIGAINTISSSLSIGMLIAFGAYAGTFSSRVASLIDIAFNLKMLGLHKERLADIVLEAPEETSQGSIDASALRPALSLHDVSFRYGEGEPWLLKQCSVSFAPDRCTVIVGESGCGKTTMSKILLGLLRPAEGTVCLDGVEFSELGGSYRGIIGSVTQDDALLAGTILGNISFFDVDARIDDIEDAARKAAIHDDIMRMPMGYQTLVGDMGSTLSGGQKQRILIARALYRKPRILFLDEATSHLDMRSEGMVCKAIAALQLTKIIIAHRAETIMTADHVMLLEGGQLIDLGSPSTYFSSERNPLRVRELDGISSLD